MFSIKALSARAATCDTATTCDKAPKTASAEAAIPATNVATVAMSHVAKGLDDFREALLLGRLHLCGNCSRYTFGSDPAGAGTCAIHGDGLVAFAMPFRCRDFAVSKNPIASDYLPDPDGTRVPETSR